MEHRRRSNLISLLITLFVLNGCHSPTDDAVISLQNPILESFSKVGDFEMSCAFESDSIPVRELKFLSAENVIIEKRYGQLSNLTQYDGNGFPIAIDETWDIPETYALSYQKSGDNLKQIWRETSNRHWPFQPETIGDIVRQVTFVVENNVIKLKIDSGRLVHEEFEYDNLGRLVNNREFIGFGENSKLSEMWTFQYDESGKLQSATRKEYTGKTEESLNFVNGVVSTYTASDGRVANCKRKKS